MLWNDSLFRTFGNDPFKASLLSRPWIYSPLSTLDMSAEHLGSKHHIPSFKTRAEYFWNAYNTSMLPYQDITYVLTYGVIDRRRENRVALFWPWGKEQGDVVDSCDLPHAKPWAGTIDVLLALNPGEHWHSISHFRFKETEAYRESNQTRCCQL